jgi:hypothetical protein
VLDDLASSKFVRTKNRWSLSPMINSQRVINLKIDEK